MESGGERERPPPPPEPTAEPGTEQPPLRVVVLHAPDEPEPRLAPLSPHRLALRILVCAPTAGCIVALVVSAVLVVFEWGSNGPNLREVALGLGILFVGATAWSGLLLLAEGLALRVAWALRPLVLVLAGCGAGLGAALAVGWVVGLFTEGPLGAWNVVQKVLQEIGRRPEKTLPIGLMALLPFGVIGSARAQGWPAAISHAATAASGLAMFLVLASIEHFSRRELPFAITTFLSLPLAAAAGLWLGERLEAKLLEWIARRPEE